MKYFELDKDGNFVCDALSPAGLENWTTTLVPSCVDRPQLVGERNADTGEWSGKWVDLGPVPSTKEQLERDERYWRDAEIKLVDVKINKLEDANQATSSMRDYRQALRDYPQQPDFPFGPRPKV